MNNDTSFDIIQESNPVQTVAQPKEDNKMLRATDRITALYCRLSVEDTKEDKKNGKEDLSNSIQNQKAILLQYARDHRFPHPTFFIDDGYSCLLYTSPSGAPGSGLLSALRRRSSGCSRKREYETAPRGRTSGKRAIRPRRAVCYFSKETEL